VGGSVEGPVEEVFTLDPASFHAVVAVAAGADEVDDCSVSLLELRDIWTCLFDLSCDLVAEGDWWWPGGHHAGHDVKVCVADSCRFDSQENFVGSRLGLGDAFELQGLVGIEISRGVGLEGFCLSFSFFKLRLHSMKNRAFFRACSVLNLFIINWNKRRVRKEVGV